MPDPVIKRGSPPSVYSAAAAVEGEPGGWALVLGNTLLRALALSPGLYIAGVRTLRGNVRTSLITSAVLSALIVAKYHQAKKHNQPYI